MARRATTALSEPATTMRYDEYRQAIIETRDQWVSGENDP